MPPRSKIFQQNRTLGCVSNHIPVITRYIEQRKENLIVTCTGRSFYTYGCSNFALLSVSPTHPEDISCLVADTFHIYTACGSKIYAWKRGNRLKHTYLGHECQVHLLLPFGPHLLSVDEDGNLKIWDIKTRNVIKETNFKNDIFRITIMMHPHMYINKILLASEQGQMQLWNINSMKMIYTFKGWNCSINIIEQSPAIDVVAIGLVSGKIILHNLKWDRTVFELLQDWGVVTSISFRIDGVPIMATGSLKGHIVLWNLEQRKVENEIQNAHFGSVTGLKCLPNEPLLVSSSPDNSLKLWAFDLVDGVGRLLRHRDGHSEHPTIIRFYGNDGCNILSTSGDCSLRVFSTETELFNKNLGKAVYLRKSSKSNGLTLEDPLIMPPIIDFAAESTSEKELDNVVAAHFGLGMVTTWSYDYLKMGELKILSKKFKFNMNVTASTLTITSCGNFVLVGYSYGHVERFSIRCGEHQNFYGGETGAHGGPVKGIDVDCLNVSVITAGRDACVKLWPFQASEDTQPITVIDVMEPVEWIRSCRENSLTAVALQDHSIAVIDVDVRQIVRRFKGHNGRLTDAAFSPDCRWLVSASKDRTIRVWDIPSGHMIDIIKVLYFCISLTFSPTGKYLATAHVGTLGISLWTNLTLYSDVPLKAVNSEEETHITSPGSFTDSISETRANEVVANSEDEDDKESEEFVSLSNHLHSELITMSSLARLKWLNLVNIEHRKRRKELTKEAYEDSTDTSLYSSSISDLNVQLDSSDDQIDGGNTKMLSLADLKSASALRPLLRKNMNSSNYEETVKILKSMKPSTIEMELQSLALDVKNVVPLLLEFMKMLYFMLGSKRDFELAQVYLSLFLKCHGTTISNKKKLAEYLSELQKAQFKSWRVLREKLFYNLSAVQHLRRS